jgi:hypothetical protein
MCVGCRAGQAARALGGKLDVPPRPATLAAVKAAPRFARSARWLAAGLAVVLAVAWFAPPRLERALRARLEAEAARRGLALHVQAIDVSVWPPLRMAGIRLERAGAWTLALESVEVTPRVGGSGRLGRAQVAAGPGVVRLPGDLVLEAVPTVWDVVTVAGHGYRAELQPSGALVFGWLPAESGDRIDVRAHQAPLGRIVSASRAGEPLLDAGTLEGTLSWRREAGASRFALEAAVRAARLPALPRSENASQVEPPGFGPPIDATLRIEGGWRPAQGALDVETWRVTTDTADMSGTLGVASLPADPLLALSVDVARLDFGRLLGALGLDQPAAVATPVGRMPEDGDLGSASLSARASARLSDPSTLVVSQRVDFTPPRRRLPALERLRGDFVHQVTAAAASRTIEVSSLSPDFVALADVPPLFVRTLLLGEDTAFFGHRGIDLEAVGAAILINVQRGSVSRGASTITQQLAKNLFLSRERELGRKLQELSLALLLEATLPKERILEIYLNVIEWGPDVYGLRPAARRYFASEPRDLSPAQMAFLVALIPGPLKYQRSIAAGIPSPAFRRLMDHLLAKLRSVDALSEGEYQAALGEEIVVSPEIASPRDPE